MPGPKKNYRVKTFNYADKPESSMANGKSTHRNMQFCKTAAGRISTARSLIKVDLKPEENTKEISQSDRKENDEILLVEEPEAVTSECLQGEDPAGVDDTLFDAAYVEYLQGLEVKSSTKRRRPPGVSDSPVAQNKIYR
jgi:hypothetical protein